MADTTNLIKLISLLSKHLFAFVTVLAILSVAVAELFLFTPTAFGTADDKRIEQQNGSNLSSVIKYLPNIFGHTVFSTGIFLATAAVSHRYGS